MWTGPGSGLQLKSGLGSGSDLSIFLDLRVELKTQRATYNYLESKFGS